MSPKATMRIPRALLLVPLLTATLLAQKPAQPPPHLALHLSTEDDRREFHLGEGILFSITYEAASPKYALASHPMDLVGGKRASIDCSPPPGKASLPPPDMDEFAAILGARCAQPPRNSNVKPRPLATRSEAATETRVLHFSPAGTYTCTAHSAEATLAGGSPGVARAIPLESVPVTFRITDDPGWEAAANQLYLKEYRQACLDTESEPADHSSLNHSIAGLDCLSALAHLLSLDTPEALDAQVALLDESVQGEGVENLTTVTSRPAEALHLLTNRLQDPQFPINATFLRFLAAWDMQQQEPAALDAATPEARLAYQALAMEKLRHYVRQAGQSLVSKSPGLLRQSTDTYRKLAEETFCGSTSLIPLKEVKATLAAGKEK